MLLFVCNDATVKLLGENLPLGEVLLLRGLLSAAVMLLISRDLRLRQLSLLLRHPWAATRSVAEVVGILLYLVGLLRVPLANAIVLLQFAPLVLTALGALTGERVTVALWLIILLGLGGVLVVTMPDLQTFDAASLLVLAAVVAFSIRDLATKKVPASYTPPIAVLFSSLATLVVGLMLAPFETWRVPDAGEAAALVLTAALTIGSFWLLFISLRQAALSVLAPFRYTAIVWAMILGYAVWGEAPSTAAILGSLIIVTAGLLMIVYPRRGGRAAAAESGREAG